MILRRRSQLAAVLVLVGELVAGAPHAALAAGTGDAASAGRPAEAKRRQTIAVMPFDNLAVQGSERLDFLRQWLPDVATRRIGESNELAVVERRAIAEILSELKLGSSSLAAGGTRLQLGRMLGAQLLLFGSFTAIGDRLRVDARVVDAESGVVLHAVDAMGKIGEPRAVASALGEALVDRLGLSIARRAVETGIDDPRALEAAEHFYAAVSLENAGRTDEAIERYRQALELAPNDREAMTRLQRLLEAAP